MKTLSTKMKLSIPLVILTVLPLVAQASAGVFPRQRNGGGDRNGGSDGGGGDTGAGSGDANNGTDGGADGGADNPNGTGDGGNNNNDPQSSLSTMVLFFCWLKLIYPL